MPVTNLTFEELSEDDEFLAGLREGNFTLVLGAGFSFGVRNKLEELTNFPSMPCVKPVVPLGHMFCEFTNKLFNTKFDDYNVAAEKWVHECENDGTFRKVFRALFEVNLSHEERQLYKSIFIPKWNNIFTLNFDDLLSKLEPNDYDLVYYPEHTTRLRPSIIHPHGCIEKSINAPEKLVFGKTQYAALENADHDLYTTIYGDVQHGKNLVVLGTQFGEDTVLRRFFRGLDDKIDLKIYHFELNNDVTVLYEQFTKKDYKFIKLEHPKHGVGTIAFLNYLKSIQTKIYHLVAPSIKTIDYSFANQILTIGDEKGREPAEFYLGKQYEDYQWYGVFKGWDYERAIFSKLKESVIQSFERSSKKRISALVVGSGGSGKSTLLRRLAKVCLDEDFVVLWIDDSNITRLMEDDSLDRAERSVKYLFIVEDWYRIKQQLTNENQIEFIQRLCDFPNSRICIGDRNKDQYIIDNLHGGSEISVFQIENAENGNAIAQIIKVYPELEDAWKLLSESVRDSFSHSTLYLILFTLTRLKGDHSFSEFDLADINEHFRSIVRSDVKRLAKEHEGLARLLAYYADMYARVKFPIPAKLFDDVCKYLDDGDKIYISECAREVVGWYLSRIHDDYNVESYRFSQDILAEIGLASSSLEQLSDIDLRLDRNQIIKLMNFLVGEAGIGRAEFVNRLLDVGAEKFDAEDLLQVVKTGLENRVFGVYASKILLHCEKIEIDKDLYHLVGKLQELDFDYPRMGLTLAHAHLAAHSEYYRKNFTSKSLNHPDITSLHDGIVSAAFQSPGNKGLKEKAAGLILKHPDITSLHHGIVSAAFQSPGNKGLKEKAAGLILNHPDITSLHGGIASAAFQSLGNKGLKEKAAGLILKHPDITSLHDGIVSAAFQSPGNKDLKVKAAGLILKHPDITSLHDGIVSAAFRNSSNEDLRVKAAGLILKHPDITSLHDGIVSAAFRNSSNEDLKVKAAGLILKHPDITSLHDGIVSAAFQSPGNKGLKENVAGLILKHPDITSLHDGIVSAAFRNSSNEDLKVKAAGLILKHPDITSLHDGIVSAAFQSPGNKGLKENVAGLILKHPDITSLHDGIVSAAFRNSSNEGLKEAVAKPILATNIETGRQAYLLKSILRSYAQPEFSQPIPVFLSAYIDREIGEFKAANLNREKISQTKRNLYYLIMSICFDRITAWSNQANYTLKNWKRAPTFLVATILFISKHNPDRIKVACKEILESWDEQANKKFTRRFSNDQLIGEHVRFALGHPELRDYALTVALEIVQKTEQTGELPEALIETAYNIVYDDEFENWNVAADSS